MSGGGRFEPSKLDLYLDGLLEGPERVAFEAELKRNPSLRAQVALQRQIDSGLRQVFVAPLAPPVVTFPRMEPRPVPVGSGAGSFILHFVRSQWLSIAAVLAIANGAYRVWDFFYQPRIPDVAYPDKAWRSKELIYYLHANHAAGDPEQLRSLDQVAQAFQAKLGQKVRMRRPPAGVELVGVSFSSPVAKTVQLLAKVHDRDVIVMSFALDDDDPQQLPVDSDLQYFRKQIGKVVLYEVSPKAINVLGQKPTSYLLDCFEDADPPAASDVR